MLWHTWPARLSAGRHATQQSSKASRLARTHSLPLSSWHVVLSWLDIVTDVLAAVSTRQLALQLPSICGMRTAPFYNCCFSIQLLLIAGSLAMQVLFAVLQAVQEQHSLNSSSTFGDPGYPRYPQDPAVGPTRPSTAATITASSSSSTRHISGQPQHTPAPALGHPATHPSPARPSCPTNSDSDSADCWAAVHQPGMLRAVGWAVLRGLTATELAYQEFGRRVLPSASRTAAVMHIRLSELVFEGPQVVISWMVLVGRLTMEEMARASEDTTGHVDLATKVLQWVSLVVGVVSLSVGCTDFMRLHGRSMWAGPPPAVLFLGLIDVSKNTWRRSALISGHALFSLFTRAFLYIMASSLTLILAFFDVRHNRSTATAARAAGHVPDSWPTVALQVVFPAMLLTSFTCNIAALHPMRDWILFPAAIVSCFVNIPWIAAPAGSPAYGSPTSLIPAALLQLLCAGAAFGLACVSLQPIRFMSPCSGYQTAQLTWLGSPVHGLGTSVATTLLPVLVAAAEILLFCTLAVVVNKERQAAAVQASQQLQQPQQQQQRPSGFPPPAPPGAPQIAPSTSSVLQSSGSGGGQQPITQQSTGAPALAYKFVFWKKPFLLCAVRVTGHPLLPVSNSP